MHLEPRDGQYREANIQIKRTPDLITGLRVTRATRTGRGTYALAHRISGKIEIDQLIVDEGHDLTSSVFVLATSWTTLGAQYRMAKDEHKSTRLRNVGPPSVLLPPLGEKLPSSTHVSHLGFNSRVAPALQHLGYTNETSDTYTIPRCSGQKE